MKKICKKKIIQEAVSVLPEKSAKKGNRNGQYLLSSYYSNGYGCKQNKSASDFWKKKGAQAE